MLRQFLPVAVILSASLTNCYSAFEVEVTFHFYTNPSGRCVGCGGASPAIPGCCDVPWPVPLDHDCPSSDTCDTALAYCWRSVGSTGLCPQNQQIPAQATLPNIRVAMFHNTTFFGFPNPGIFVRNESWQVS